MRPFLACLLLLPLSARGQSVKPTATATPADLTTLSGRTYKHARVQRVEPDGITCMFDGGVTKIPFTDLSEAIQKQYGYDPAKARAFAAADAEAQDAEAVLRQGEAATAAKQRQAMHEQAAEDISKMPKPPQVGGTTALNEPVVNRSPVMGKVLQVVDDGILIIHGKEVMLLMDYPRQDQVVDGAKCTVTGQRVGTYSYDTAAGSSAQIPRYHYLSGVIATTR